MKKGDEDRNEIEVNKKHTNINHAALRALAVQHEIPNETGTVLNYCDCIMAYFKQTYPASSAHRK
jgi:hypothetical protein